MRRSLLASLVMAVSMLCAAQTKPGADITSVATSGTVSGNRYVNSFFGVTIEAPEATFQLNPLLNSGGQRARLLQVLSKRGDWADTFTLAVLADSLRNYPTLQSPERYVRSVRHQLERRLIHRTRRFPNYDLRSAVCRCGCTRAGRVRQEILPRNICYVPAGLRPLARCRSRFA